MKTERLQRQQLEELRLVKAKNQSPSRPNLNRTADDSQRIRPLMKSTARKSTKSFRRGSVHDENSNSMDSTKSPSKSSSEIGENEEKENGSGSDGCIRLSGEAAKLNKENDKITEEDENFFEQSDKSPNEKSNNESEENEEATEENKECTEENKECTEKNKECTDTKESTEENKESTEENNDFTEENKESTEENKEPTEESCKTRDKTDKLQEEVITQHIKGNETVEENAKDILKENAKRFLAGEAEFDDDDDLPTSPVSAELLKLAVTSMINYDIEEEEPSDWEDREPPLEGLEEEEEVLDKSDVVDVSTEFVLLSSDEEILHEKNKASKVVDTSNDDEKTKGQQNLEKAVEDATETADKTSEENDDEPMETNDIDHGDEDGRLQLDYSSEEEPLFTDEKAKKQKDKNVTEEDKDEVNSVANNKEEPNNINQENTNCDNSETESKTNQKDEELVENKLEDCLEMESVCSKELETDQNRIKEIVELVDDLTKDINDEEDELGHTSDSDGLFKLELSLDENDSEEDVSKECQDEKSSIVKEEENDPDVKPSVSGVDALSSNTEAGNITSIKTDDDEDNKMLTVMKDEQDIKSKQSNNEIDPTVDIKIDECIENSASGSLDKSKESETKVIDEKLNVKDDITMEKEDCKLDLESDNIVVNKESKDIIDDNNEDCIALDDKKYKESSKLINSLILDDSDPIKALLEETESIMEGDKIEETSSSGRKRSNSEDYFDSVETKRSKQNSSLEINDDALENQDFEMDDEIEEIAEPEPKKLTMKLLEELFRERVKEFVEETNKSTILQLSGRCSSLEKNMEKWKKKAIELENQVVDLTAELQKYKKQVVSKKQEKPAVSNPSQTNSTASSAASSVVHTPTSTVTSNSVLRGSAVTKTTPTNKISMPTPIPKPAVPLALIANTAAKSPAKSSSTIIDLTEEDEDKQTTVSTALVKNNANIVTSSFVSLPTATMLQTAPRPSVSSTITSQVVTLPMVSSGLQSMVQLIPSTQNTLASTAVRINRPNLPGTTQTAVGPFTAPPGTQVTYLVPSNAAGASGIGNLPRQLVAFSSNNANLLPGNRAPMQTILVRMNSPAGNLTPMARIPGSNASITNSNISVLPPNASIRPVTHIPTANMTQTKVPQPVPARQMKPHHPAALPPQPMYAHNPNFKAIPPKPALKISKVANGIVLSWNMTVNQTHSDISAYQLYAYQEGVGPPSTSLWKKVGDVKALPLPMACTLTQFVDGNKYHFAVRAVDNHTRCGPFSDPTHILLPTSKK